MSIGLEGRIKWRITAPYHVQLRLDEKEPLKIPSEISVRGQVVRVFRSDGHLGPGDRVAFKIWLCRPGDEPTGPAYIYYEPFMQASHIEAYLHGNPPNCELAAYEFVVLSAPTDEPSMTVIQLQELDDSSATSKGQSVLKKKSWWRRMLSNNVDRNL